MTQISPSPFIPFQEIEPLLKLIKNKTSSSEAEIAETIGWSSSYFRKGRIENKIRLGLKYALLGLASELKFTAESRVSIQQNHFTFDELSLLFQSLLEFRQKHPGEPTSKALLTKVASSLSLY